MPRGGKRKNAGRPPKWGGRKIKKKGIIAEIDHAIEAFCNLFHATKHDITAAQLLVRHLEQQKAGR